MITKSISFTSESKEKMENTNRSAEEEEVQITTTISQEILEHNISYEPPELRNDNPVKHDIPVINMQNCNVTINYHLS